MQFILQPLVDPLRTLGGATLAQTHVEKLRRRLTEGAPALNADGPGEMVIIDFDGIDSVTSSYLKALLAPFVGELYAGSSRELNVFPVLRSLGPLPREELQSLMSLWRRVVVVEATDLRGEELFCARIHGELEKSLRETLAALVRKGSATAPELHAEVGAPATNVTAWNNKLNDLYARRLARRRRSGRAWVYEPIARELEYG